MPQNLTDNWQMAKILTDNWHLKPPIQTLMDGPHYIYIYNYHIKPTHDQLWGLLAGRSSV